AVRTLLHEVLDALLALLLHLGRLDRLGPRVGLTGAAAGQPGGDNDRREGRQRGSHDLTTDTHERLLGTGACPARAPRAARGSGPCRTHRGDVGHHGGATGPARGRPGREATAPAAADSPVRAWASRRAGAAAATGRSVRAWGKAKAPSSS